MMIVPLDPYAVQDTKELLTPALLLYPELVEANIHITLTILGNDENRWRPHIKTAKLPLVIRSLVNHGVKKLKASTSLEVLTACECGATDVLLALSVTGGNASRLLEIAAQFPSVRISVLVEALEQASFWKEQKIGCFIDINPGMNRTGILQDHLDDIEQVARATGDQFRGLHYYDGHMGAYPLQEREKPAHEGYDRLMTIVDTLERNGLSIGEVITSGTPAFPFALTYLPFQGRRFQHSVSPGTVVFNDATSLAQLPHEYGYVPAVLVLSTIVSQPVPGVITCDAGHKSVSADAGIPTCVVVDRPDWTPLTPSEEHLPITVGDTDGTQIGSQVYLLPRHVCPTVNNFDEAVVIADGRIDGLEPVAARGHENPLALHKFIGKAQSPGNLLPVLD